MGQRCLLISFMGLCFGIGATSASFQDSGRRDSWNEQLRISETGPTSAKQRNGGIFRVLWDFVKKPIKAIAFLTQVIQFFNIIRLLLRKFYGTLKVQSDMF